MSDKASCQLEQISSVHRYLDTSRTATDISPLFLPAILNHAVHNPRRYRCSSELFFFYPSILSFAVHNPPRRTTSKLVTTINHNGAQDCTHKHGEVDEDVRHASQGWLDLQIIGKLHPISRLVLSNCRETTLTSLFFLQEDDYKPLSLCILPGWEATEIMRALHKMYKKPTKNDFDTEIALLFQKGTEYVNYRTSPEGRARFSTEIPSTATFWSVPKQDTMFKDVHVATVYRFTLKVMEARQIWVEKHTHLQFIEQYNYQRKTVHAVELFDTAIASAGVLHGDIAGTLAIFMTGSLAVQVEEDDKSGQIRLQVDSAGTSLFTLDELRALDSCNKAATVEEGSTKQVDDAKDGQDEGMTDAGTDAYDTYLQKMQELDLENAEDDEMMDVW